MLQQLILDIKLHKDDFALPLVIVPFGFLLGFGLCCVIMFTEDDPGSWVTFGTFMALGGLILFSVVLFAKFYQEFMLALSMGRTRGEFLVSYALRSFLWLALGYGLMLALYRVELAAGGKLFAPWPLEVDPTFLMDWRFILPLLPGVVLISMFVGSLYSYFGKKAMVPLWFLWMALCMFGPRLVHEENMAVLARIPVPAWIVLGVTLAAAMLATVIGLGKKQMVR